MCWKIFVLMGCWVNLALSVLRNDHFSSQYFTRKMRKIFFLTNFISMCAVYFAFRFWVSTMIKWSSHPVKFELKIISYAEKADNLQWMLIFFWYQWMPSSGCPNKNTTNDMSRKEKSKDIQKHRASWSGRGT